MTAQYKLFGPSAERIPATDLPIVLAELQAVFGTHIPRMELTKALESKKDHGDVDIICLVNNFCDIQPLVMNCLQEKCLKCSANHDVFSFLYASPGLQKKIHIDFILCKDQAQFEIKKHYYSLNDFAGVIGIVAKKLLFKYGTQFFGKRYVDKKGCWHYIPLTMDLNTGLHILGYNPYLMNDIKNPDDIVEFVASSPLVDGSFFLEDGLVARDRQAVHRRTSLNYVLNGVRAKNIVRKIDDPDYFLKEYDDFLWKIALGKAEIDAKTYKLNQRYNGDWLMANLGMKQGVEIGNALKALSKHFGDSLEETDEKTVLEYLKNV